MYWYGYVILGLMFIATLAIAGAGIIVLRKRQEWFYRALALISSLLGISMFLTLVIALLAEFDPFTAIAIEIAVALGLGIFIFWLAMLVDCAVNEKDNNERLLWVLIIIFTNWIGALIYLLARRPLRLKKASE
ncbi:MAG: PLDc_N domain-containing protein [Dehalococcoidaceae bacterium]|nr:PLDc_N domain-containing protein [Dehalococcoidaceae bacterium]